MIVNIRRAQGEDRRPGAAQQQLRQHEDEDGKGGRPGGLFNAVVLAVELLVVRGQGRGGEPLIRVQQRVQAAQVELVQHTLLLAVAGDLADVLVRDVRAEGEGRAVGVGEEVGQREEDRAEAHHDGADADKSGYVAPRAEVGDKDDGEDVANLVHRSDYAGDGGGDFVALLDGGDDGVEVAGGERLLQDDEEGEQEDEDLDGGERLGAGRLAGKVSAVPQLGVVVLQQLRLLLLSR